MRKKEDQNLTSPNLINANEAVLDKWRAQIELHALTRDALYLVSDTETSGTMVICPKTKLFNRVLEWSFVVCEKREDGLLYPLTDESGEVIKLNEPINPFAEPIKTKKQQSSIKEIDKESTEIHGIDIEYLFAIEKETQSTTELNAKNENEPLVIDSGSTKHCVATLREPLPHCAPYFELVWCAVQRLFNFSRYLQGDVSIFLVFYNAPFDVRFLNNEMSLIDNPPIESYFIPIDALKIATALLKGKELVSKLTLDAVYEFGLRRYPQQIKVVERPYHASYIDSLILIEAFNTLSLYRKEIQQ